MRRTRAPRTHPADNSTVRADVFLRNAREKRLTSLPRVIAVVGSEAYLRTHCVQSIRRTLAQTQSVFRVDLPGDTTEPTRFLEAVNERVLGAEVPLVVLDNTTGRQSWLESAERREVLEGVLKSPPVDTWLVITARALPRTTRLAKLVEQNGLRVDCEPLPGDVLRGWLIRQAALRKLRLTTRTADAFLRYVGTEMNRVAAELEKVDVYLGNEEHITETVLREVCCFNGSSRTWDLIEHLGAGEIRQALEVLGVLLAHGQSPYEIVGLLAWRIRQHWQVAGALAAGDSLNHAMRGAGVPPFAMNQFRRAQNRMSLDRCRELHELLLKVDQKADGVSIESKLWFFVLQQSRGR